MFSRSVWFISSTGVLSLYGVFPVIFFFFIMDVILPLEMWLSYTAWFYVECLHFIGFMVQVLADAVWLRGTLYCSLLTVHMNCLEKSFFVLCMF